MLGEDGSVRDSLCTDFGRMHRGTPATVIEARREEDVLRALDGARRGGVSLTVRGAGHSIDGQSVARGGILLVNNADAGDVVRLDGDVAWVDARASWRAVEGALNAAGRRAPVLADWLDLTVGGTLSVGGLGITSITDGMQLDHVLRARVIRPDGEVRWCSPDEDAELFRFVMGGLGQVGVIERVLMRTRPNLPFTHLYRRPHGNLTEMVAFAESLCAEETGVEHYNGYRRDDQCWSEHGYLADHEARDDSKLSSLATEGVAGWSAERDFSLALHARRVTWLSAYPDHVRPWAAYVVPLDRGAAFAEMLEGALRDPMFARAVEAIQLFVIRRDGAPVPFALAPAPPGRLLLGFGLYPMVKRRDLPGIAAVLRRLDGLLAGAADLGGRPYLYGRHALTAELKRRIYGRDMETLAALRSDGAFLNGNGLG